MTVALAMVTREVYMLGGGPVRERELTTDGAYHGLWTAAKRGLLVAPGQGYDTWSITPNGEDFVEGRLAFRTLRLPCVSPQGGKPPGGSTLHLVSDINLGISHRGVE